jgi:tetratricopeptide (TPR) repeat protein
MKFAATLFLFGALAAHGADPREHLAQGQDHYQKGEYDKAEQDFGTSAEAAAPAKLDPAVAKYDRANALMNMNKPEEASRYYQEALQTTDLDLQKKAYFNRGNALMAMAEPPEKQNQLDEAKKAVDEAINMYVGAMTLDPSDEDPKVNFELALNKKQELEKKQQQQQQQQQNKDDKEKKDENKKDQEQKQDNEQDQDKKDQQKKQDEEKQKQDQKNQQEKQNQQQDQKEGQDQQQQQAAKPEEMTKEEAMQLLDALKQQEQADREKIRVSAGQPVPVEKDW